MEIFIIGHKTTNYGFWEEHPYKPLQVGSGETFLALRDNTGDNISEWNPVYAENTGLYWIYRNVDSDIIGVCQYRRRIKVPAGAFEKYDAVVCKPIKVVTVENQYRVCHSSVDLEITKKIIEKYYPEYLESWINTMKGSILFYSNRFVLKKDLFMNYCDFLFGVCEKYKDFMGWKTVEDVKKTVEQQIEAKKRNGARGLAYQLQVFGFLSERLFTVWLNKSVPADKVLVTEGVFMENINI